MPGKCFRTRQGPGLGTSRGAVVGVPAAATSTRGRVPPARILCRILHRQYFFAASSDPLGPPPLQSHAPCSQSQPNIAPFSTPPTRRTLLLATLPAALLLPSAPAPPAAASTSTPPGMTLEAAIATTSTSVAALESSYAELIRIDSCTAVEPLPDCLDPSTARRIASQLASASARLLVALPIVAADRAYTTPPPSKRRRGVLGLLDSLERATRPGGPSLDVADLEWLEEVEARTTKAVAQLGLLRRAAEAVAQSEGQGLSAGPDEGGAEGAAVRPGSGPGPGVGAFAEVRRRLADLTYLCLRDVRAVLAEDG